MKTYSVYIFDLDGTLTDTMSVWLGIFRDGLSKFGITPPDDKTLSQHTHDWRQMLELGLAEDKLDDFIKFAHGAANERLPKAALHTGARDMLAELQKRGKHIAVFTTMDRPIMEPALASQKLEEFAEVSVAGTDVPNRKPAPDGILKVLEQLQIPETDYANVVYIGDKDTDIFCAHNAKVDGILYYPPAHQEFYDRNSLLACKPEAVIEDWKELTATNE